ncbi:MAG: hypothetical protein GF313_14260 [Caldithrix sp.]|nr:hypothetical protein [Caldithrix sp.]
MRGSTHIRCRLPLCQTPHSTPFKSGRR